MSSISPNQLRITSSFINTAIVSTRRSIANAKETCAVVKQNVKDLKDKDGTEVPGSEAFYIENIPNPGGEPKQIKHRIYKTYRVTGGDDVNDLCGKLDREIADVENTLSSVQQFNKELKNTAIVVAGYIIGIQKELGNGVSLNDKDFEKYLAGSISYTRNEAANGEYIDKSKIMNMIQYWTDEPIRFEKQKNGTYKMYQGSVAMGWTDAATATMMMVQLKSKKKNQKSILEYKKKEDVDGVPDPSRGKGGKSGKSVPDNGKPTKEEDPYTLKEGENYKVVEVTDDEGNVHIHTVTRNGPYVTVYDENGNEIKQTGTILSTSSVDDHGHTVITRADGTKMTLDKDGMEKIPNSKSNIVSTSSVDDKGHTVITRADGTKMTLDKDGMEKIPNSKSGGAKSSSGSTPKLSTSSVGSNTGSSLGSKGSTPKSSTGSANTNSTKTTPDMYNKYNLNPEDGLEVIPNSKSNIVSTSSVDDHGHSVITRADGTKMTLNSEGMETIPNSKSNILSTSSVDDHGHSVITRADGTKMTLNDTGMETIVNSKSDIVSKSSINSQGNTIITRADGTKMTLNSSGMETIGKSDFKN